MKYRVRHVTTYRYAEPVDLGSHMLHLSPRQLPHQAVLDASILASPEPGRTSERPDHFGNAVVWMFIDRPHDRFEVTLDATVEVLFPRQADAVKSLPWEEVAAAAREGDAESWQASEFVFDSPMLPLEPGAGGYAAASFPPGRPILAGLIDLNSRIRRDFAFRSGVTTISTPVARVLAQRAGVCQDFTHLMISGLRALGLPARYVSGYLRTKPPPGTTRRRGADQSHAWVGAWLGPARGWVDLDPTNDLVVRDEHVVLAWGRDYSDISPVRGMILGGGHHTVSVAVDLDAV
jgi:transglutaminase-like putative cysteine protease